MYVAASRLLAVMYQPMPLPLQGPSFNDMSDNMPLEYASAICSLIALSQRFTGLWRLKEVSFCNC